MNIFVSGDDQRLQAVREEVLRRGHQLTDETLCHVCLLPLPDSNEAARELAAVHGRDRLLLHGRLNASMRQTLIHQGWRLKDIQQEEDYVQQNALISAEGAVYAAMAHTDFALRNARCAVVGYGRIAKELTRLLLSLGAEVHVAARKKRARLFAWLRGARTFHTEDLLSAFDGVQIVFNTVPSPIITPEALSALSPETLLIELASPPYGFDMEAARKLQLNAILESGIPARYAPRTAAVLLADYLEAGEQHA